MVHCSDQKTNVAIGVIMLTVALGVLPMARAGAVMEEYRHEHWQYGRTQSCDSGSTQRCGPNQWGDVEPACSQLGTQSPIDLTAAVHHPTMMAAKDALILHHPSNGTETCAGAFQLNEHTVELDFDGLSCSGVWHATFSGKDFNLAEFHYHSPSEHTMDGTYFPMEVHHVHKAADGQALVISVLVGVGEPTHEQPALAPAILMDTLYKSPMTAQDWPNASFFHEVHDVDVEFLNPYKNFIPNLYTSEGFLYYNGSFTTPGCTTDTVWIISKTPVMVPQQVVDQYRRQINHNPNNQLAPFHDITQLGEMPSFNQMAGSNIKWNATLGCNNRPIQQLQGVDMPARKLYTIPGEGDSMAKPQCKHVKEMYKENNCCGLPEKEITSFPSWMKV